MKEKMPLFESVPLTFCSFGHCHCRPYSVLHLPFDKNYLLHFAGAVYLYGLCHIQENMHFKIGGPGVFIGCFAYERAGAVVAFQRCPHCNSVFRLKDTLFAFFHPSVEGKIKWKRRLEGGWQLGEIFFGASEDWLFQKVDDAPVSPILFVLPKSWSLERAGVRLHCIHDKLRPLCGITAISWNLASYFYIVRVTVLTSLNFLRREK